LNCKHLQNAKREQKRTKLQAKNQKNEGLKSDRDQLLHFLQLVGISEQFDHVPGNGVGKWLPGFSEQLRSKNRSKKKQHVPNWNKFNCCKLRNGSRELVSLVSF
jgi:hypothetical protein